MKQTLNINIGNSIIHIEEDAYAVLTNYLLEVKQHFGKSADDFEIVSDIENRIAEMFLEILEGQQKQVIELEDVQVVIGLMGSVKDFETETEEEPAAAYIQSGPAVTAERKLYRDTEEAMLAGVCSGLSHYLKMDVSILRIIAVLSVFLAGSGFIAYLILWIAIPPAVTRSEKMAMKGEAVNLQGFKRSFEEELSNLKENLHRAGEDLQPLVKRSGTFISEFVEVLGTFIQGAGKNIFKFIAVIVLTFGSLAFLIALISLAATLGFWDSTANQVFPFNIIDESYFTPFMIASFVTIAIPTLALILFSIRIIFNSRAISKTLSYGLLLIWLAGLSVSIYLVAKTVYEFKQEAEFSQVLPLKSFPVYQLVMDESMVFNKEDSLRYQLNSADYAGKIIHNDHDDLFNLPRNVSLRIEKSESAASSLTESYRSQGLNFETALYHAKNINYDFTQVDSVIKFSSAIYLKENAKWRDQRIELVLRLPIGAKLKIDENMNHYLQNFSWWACNEQNRSNGFYYAVMTADGLECQFKEEETDLK